LWVYSWYLVCYLANHYDTGFAAVKTAMKLGPGHRIVTVLSDSGSRHLSRFWAKAGDVGGAVDTKLEDVLNAKDDE
jgi:cysteine synthase A